MDIPTGEAVYRAFRNLPRSYVNSSNQLWMLETMLNEAGFTISLQHEEDLKRLAPDAAAAAMETLHSWHTLRLPHDQLAELVRRDVA